MQFVPDPGEEDADIVDVILEIGCLWIEQEGNLPFRSKVMLFHLSFHISFPLLPGQCSIFIFKSEDSHDDSSRRFSNPFKGLMLPCLNDEQEGGESESLIYWKGDSAVCFSVLLR